jgi:S-adenosylmethionine:tRNA ribosyltransferase-isomerase
MKLSDFDFDLPESRIAKYPAEPRDASRLLHVAGQNIGHHHVYDLPSLVNAGDVIVLNDTKVIPARLYGRLGQARIEVFLHKRLANGEWLTFAKPGKKLSEGFVIDFAEGFSATVLEKTEKGDVRVAFATSGRDLFDCLADVGHMPLPPYIDRADTKEDEDRYQTVYAREEGSVAAPTAGLHFTSELLQRLKDKNVHIERLTLHVGAGTFAPVRVDDIQQHQMHSEWGHIDATTADRINALRQKGGRLLAVGTTVTRLLESASGEDGILRPFSGETDIFIYPGYRFHIVDRLMTNFHLPQSTLFMLVSAFSGLATMKNAYQTAIEKEYRFYSYGDACLLEKQHGLSE